ncbi:MAG: immunoglobulin domain-containing protein [Bacteroidetes bacterium]|nr:immunoglobulin domain-containing protein [Bacteroidota bacterium]
MWNGPNGFVASGQNITIDNVNASHSGVYTARAYRTGGTSLITSVGANVNISVLPCASTVSLKAYIKGFYVDSGRMTTVLLNHSLSPSTTLTDSIQVELHQSNAPYAMVATAKVALNTNGTAIATFSSIVGSYYIVIKHPTTVQTWSSVPVTLGASPTSYDFTNAASKAYGDNMKKLSRVIGLFFG